MKSIKAISFIIISISLIWGETLPKVGTNPTFKTTGNVVIENTSRSSNNRTDTTTIFFDDMEGGTDDWTLETGWVETNSSYSSPTTSMNFDDNNYGMLQSLISPFISLPELLSENELIQFSFDVWCDFPDADGDADNYLEDYYFVEVGTQSGIYLDDWLQRLESPEITLSGSAQELTFKLRYEIEPYSGDSQDVDGCIIDGWDAANVRISTDGGSTWSVINGTPSYNSLSCYAWFYNNDGCTVPGWGGYTNGWIDASFDLSAYAGQDVKIAMYFGSDPFETDIGLFLDTGNVWAVDYSDSIDDSNIIRSSVGIAANVFTPIGPLSWTLSQAITKASTDSTETFNFNIGTSF